jgi:predicted RNA polymerase sigma factor
MGRFGEALGLLRGFPASENVSRQFELRLWYVTGDILERAGRRAEAREEFRRVVRHDPQAFDAAERLAKLE